jgi:hypothetical protein
MILYIFGSEFCFYFNQHSLAAVLQKDINFEEYVIIVTADIGIRAGLRKVKP